MIRPGTGNLLLADVDALVNTVNCEGVMGKGIALQFKAAWPQMFEAYAVAAQLGEIQLGHVHVFPTGRLLRPKYILNFPTKGHWRARSRLVDVDAGLADLVRVIRELNIRSIAVPPLGAGNGGLNWEDVRPRIVAALEPLVDVDVLLFEPQGAPPAGERPVATERPAMNATRAAVLGLMGRYSVLAYQLTQIEVQKLAYLLQEAGEPLKLTYKAHTYGPYADQLYHLMQRMEGHQIRGIEDRSPGASIELQPGAVEEAEAALAHLPETRARFERVARLIKGFETPYSMELLATVHWVAHRDPSRPRHADECVKAVHSWNERKRRVMQPRHIVLAWDRLSEQGWLPGRGAEAPSIDQ